MQVKSEPCKSETDDICPQHYDLCGLDTCIDGFLQDKSIAATGFKEFYSCNDACTHSSVPCMAITNKTEYCPHGYWLCEDKLQCVLKGYGLASGDFISNLCDGTEHCKDGSDEHFSQCLEVVLVLITQ